MLLENGSGRAEAASRLRTGLLIALALWIAVAAQPEAPMTSGPGLDPGWVLGLSMAHAQGLVHGKDIIWTYGPLGYLSLPETTTGPMGMALAYHLGLYLLWVLALVRLTLSAHNRTPVWCALAIGLAGIMEPELTNDHLELAFFTIAALALLEEGSWLVLELVLLAFLAALGLLVKVSLGIECAIVFAGVLAAAVSAGALQRRHIALAALLPAFTFALFWLSTGSPESFIPYLRYTWNMASGYSESMTVLGPFWQAAVAAITLILLFLVLPLLANSRREIYAAFVPSAASAFFVFKNAMIRQDGHAALFHVKLVLATVFLLVTAKTLRYRRALIVFQAVCFLVAYPVVSETWPNIGAKMRMRLSLLSGASGSALLHWPGVWNQVRRSSEAALSRERLGPAFASAIGKGSVDVTPWEVGQVKANGWTWRPAPIFQSYAAYTPLLDGINGAHYESRGAADFLLVAWMSVDGRHPFFEDPLSWRVLLDRYRSDISDGATLLMRRAPAPRFDGLQPVAYAVGRWNETVVVPPPDLATGGPRAALPAPPPAPQSREPLVLSAGVRKSLYGAARAVIYRLSPVWIDVTHQSGAKQRFRAVPANLISGVIVDPLPMGLEDLKRIGQTGCMPPDPVVSLRMVTSGPREFRSEIPLQWSRLRTRRAGLERAGLEKDTNAAACP